jgi:ABC-type nickel/cobalt efflux system permease component RcnA
MLTDTRSRVIPLLLLIARSKLVPDFALTIHFVNLIITALYTRSIPSTVAWWILQILSAALMTSLGMWACQWRELRPIAFGGGAKDAPAAAAAAAASNGHAPELEAGEGFVMGGRRGGGGGGGSDGAGTYEMVGMAPKSGG